MQAERIAASAELHYVRRAQGEYLPLESPEAAAAYPYTPSDRERLARHRARLAVGGADRVKDRLLALADATRADEIIVTTMVFDHAARRHSYELLAKAFALPRNDTVPGRKRGRGTPRHLSAMYRPSIG